MYFIKREEWLKKGLTGRINKVLKHPFYVIHHTATFQTEYKGNINYLDRMHKKRGFLLIGYHFIIGVDGKIFEGRKIGEEGAHVKRFNDSIGVALIGNFEEENIKKEQLESLLKLMFFLNNNLLINRFTFHFLLNENTLCGRWIYGKIIKNKNKKFFKFPEDLFYNLLWVQTPE